MPLEAEQEDTILNSEGDQASQSSDTESSVSRSSNGSASYIPDDMTKAGHQGAIAKQSAPNASERDKIDGALGARA